MNLMQLYIAFISDVHLGHQKTPTRFILDNLDKYAFPDTTETARLNIIFINGDWTHRLLDNASNDTIEIRKWVAKWLRQCKKNDTVVRVLKGTTLHDWDQSIIFIEENENHDIGCDLKYIEDIHIEYMDRFGIHVLYVPDEARVNAQKTWEEVTEQMVSLGIDKVDLACMHGAFPYQLPPMAEQSVLHDPEKYESIVRGYISIGHIHQMSTCGKIIAQGSFDRLCHGDEGEKGHIRLDHGEVIWVPNPEAMRYLTLEVMGLAADDVIECVKKALGDDESQCRIRLRCNREDVAIGMLKRLSEQFKFCHFDTPDIKSIKKKENVFQEVKERKHIQLPTLTKDNLVTELIAKIKETYPDKVDNCNKVLKVYVDAIG